MEKLRVAWLVGPWDKTEAATADLPANVTINEVGGDTLVFRTGPTKEVGARIKLAIPAARLVSALMVEVDADA